MSLIINREQEQALIEEVRRRLDYDMNTGTLYWRDDPLASLAFLQRWAGKPAFTARNREGFHVGKLGKEQWKADRVIWMIQHGQLRRDIYHANGNNADDTIINLRAHGLRETMGYPPALYGYLQSIGSLP